MRLWKALGLAVFSLWITSCQMAPTKVKETREVNFKDLTKKASQKINITPDTQVVDARSAFEYSMMHIPGSIPIDWHQYAQNRLPAAGRLLSDKSLIARSLAFKGLTPAQPVVVIGQALQGQGEDHLPPRRAARRPQGPLQCGSRREQVAGHRPTRG